MQGGQHLYPPVLGFLPVAGALPSPPGSRLLECLCYGTLCPVFLALMGTDGPLCARDLACRCGAVPWTGMSFSCYCFWVKSDPLEGGFLDVFYLLCSRGGAIRQKSFGPKMGHTLVSLKFTPQMTTSVSGFSEEKQEGPFHWNKTIFLFTQSFL